MKRRWPRYSGETGRVEDLCCVDHFCGRGYVGIWSGSAEAANNGTSNLLVL